ncbi:hypothetical protein GCM10010261_16950 [Streptomyces pilosus]|nr:hypothetical protein GCM10010261_16950 [Streptomyces pilosus]
MLTDNAWAYTKNTWRRTCHDLDISPRWTRPWRPQTNGRVERFHRTLLEEWAYARPYHSEQERRDAFSGITGHCFSFSLGRLGVTGSNAVMR